MHILILCTGNICRSPYAEHRLRLALHRADVQGIEVSSAGLAATEGRSCPEVTVALGAEAGVTLGAHRSRQVLEEDLEGIGLVLVMEAEHVRRLRDLVPGFPPERIRLLTEYCPGPRRPPEVPDPHRADRWAHSLTYRLIDVCVEGVILSLRQAGVFLPPHAAVPSTHPAQ